MSCSNRLWVIDLSVAAGTTVNAPTHVEDGIPGAIDAGTYIRVVDSIVANMLDDGTGSSAYISFSTQSNAATSILTLGKTFGVSEGDTFSVHFPHGLPIYDLIAGTDTGTYRTTRGNKTSATIQKFNVTCPSTASGIVLVSYRWVPLASLG